MEREDGEHSSIELKSLKMASYGTSANGDSNKAREADEGLELNQVDLEVSDNVRSESETSTGEDSESDSDEDTCCPDLCRSLKIKKKHCSNRCLTLAEKHCPSRCLTLVKKCCPSLGQTRRSQKKRETWDNKFQFILSLVGYAVGLGNVWRFSYLCAKNGGSAFLFPYLIMLFVLGIPLFYLELTLGQGTKKGPVGAWKKISPNLMGIGVASLIVNSYICVYYNIIIAWVIYYFFHSFTAYLPWGNCFGYTLLGLNETLRMELLRNNTGPEWSSCFNASTEFYWYNTALEASSDIGVAETFNWRLFLCLMAAWVIIYLCLFRGIKSSGKIIYFTATFPYVVLVCLFFRAVTLEGAGTGLRFLFLPEGDWFARVFDPVVWLDAATQIFFSLGLSIGALVALASYSKPRNNALVDSVIVCLMNSGTSIFASIVVFSVVGFRATQLGIDVSLVSEGPGLAFVIFSEALLRMLGAPFWALLFFIMLFTLGLDSQFATLEGVITVLRDNKRIKKMRKELLVAILCFGFFIVSIPFILGNGVYLFSLFDQFAAGVPLLLVGFFEFIAVGWAFGVKRYFSEFTKAYHPFMRHMWMVLWKYVDPLIMLVIFFASVLREVIEPLTYAVYRNFVESRVRYPEWAQFVGSVIILSSVLFIPIILIVKLIAHQEARDEGLEFFRRQKQDALDFFQDVRAAITRVRGRWSPQVNEEEEVAVYRHMSSSSVEGETPSSSTQVNSDPQQ